MESPPEWYEGLNSISHIIKTTKISFTEKELDKLTSILYPKIQSIGTSDDLTFLVSLAYGIDNEKFKKFISDALTEALDNHFDTDLFYQATIHEVIEFDSHKFDRFRTLVKPSGKWKEHLGFFGNPIVPRHTPLDQFFDLCFKFQIETSSFTELKGLDPYYDWILDMQGFDYSNFNPSWVGSQTVSFHNHARKYDVVKEILVNYLKKKNDEKVGRAFFHMFIKCNN